MSTDRVVVHAVLNVIDGATNEVSRECHIDEVFRLVRHIDDATDGSWLAITIVHIEDHPALLTDMKARGQL